MTPYTSTLFIIYCKANHPLSLFSFILQALLYALLKLPLCRHLLFSFECFNPFIVLLKLKWGGLAFIPFCSYNSLYYFVVGKSSLYFILLFSYPLTFFVLKTSLKKYSSLLRNFIIQSLLSLHRKANLPPYIFFYSLYLKVEYLPHPLKRVRL